MFFVCLQETLVEVLGIKERSLTHLEQLTEQLEQKEHTIACLKSKLLKFNENTPDMLYRVKQQVDWFSENVAQQCAKGNIPEEVNNKLPFFTSAECPQSQDVFITKYIHCNKLDEHRFIEHINKLLGFISARRERQKLPFRRPTET